MKFEKPTSTWCVRSTRYKGVQSKGVQETKEYKKQRSRNEQQYKGVQEAKEYKKQSKPSEETHEASNQHSSHTHPMVMIFCLLTSSKTVRCWRSFCPQGKSAVINDHYQTSSKRGKPSANKLLGRQHTCTQENKATLSRPLSQHAHQHMYMCLLCCSGGDSGT